MACTVIYRPAASFSFLYLFFAATKFCSWCCPHPFHLLFARWLFYGLCCASFVNLVSLFTAPSPCTVMQTAALLSRSLRFKVRVRLAPFSSASKGHGSDFSSPLHRPPSPIPLSDLFSFPSRREQWLLKVCGYRMPQIALPNCRIKINDSHCVSVFVLECPLLHWENILTP